jgi:hypothetical protein
MLVILTIASTSMALLMSVVAWRAVREERRRSDARIAALAADIQQPIDLDLPSAAFTTAAPCAPSLDASLAARYAPSADSTAAPTHELFTSSTPSTRTGGRWGIALAAGGLVVATAAAAAIVFSGESATVPISTTTAAAAAPVAAAPLELVALAHERDGDSLTVRGVVRNPSTGTAMDRLVAVVFVFNREGGFAGSGRAAVESPSLIPGGESGFVVTVPAAGDIGRYRVSFRSDDQVISHVDKRSGS